MTTKEWVSARAAMAISNNSSNDNVSGEQTERILRIADSSGEAWRLEFGTNPPNGLILAVHLACFERLPRPESTH